MTIKCYDEKKQCPHRKAGLCFNPCVLKAAQDGVELGMTAAKSNPVSVEDLKL